MNWLTNLWSEKKPAPKYHCLSLQCQATFEIKMPWRTKKKMGWDSGCCGIIRCYECKRTVYCAKLNIETCIACMKDCCDYCFENVHGTEKSRMKYSKTHEKLTAEQVGRDANEIRAEWILQKIRF